MPFRFERFAKTIPTRRVIVIAATGIAGLALLAGVALHWANDWAKTEGRRAAEQMARTHAGLFASELQKYRLLPLVLTEYPEIQGTLEHRPGMAAELDAKLYLLAQRTNAAVIYLLDDNGVAIAASNSRLTTSFVGHDYRFRRYFRDAMTTGHAEEFALGTVTGRPGLFLAHAAMRDGKPVGVIVVKVEFDQIEEQWRAQENPTVVVAPGGAVMLTSQPNLRFRKLTIASNGTSAPSVMGDGRPFVVGESSVPIEGWTLRHFEPLDPYQATPATLVRELLFGATLLFLVLMGLAIRSHEKLLLQRENRRLLEDEVERRTTELRDSNERLRIESNERQQADLRLREAREELAQANRLGIIGQITAGVAHEVNQPVAAIQTCAENASRLMARSQIDRAQHNLDRITALTERIGRITSELRRFARRGTPRLGVVSLAGALDGALLLLDDRLRGTEVTVDRPSPPADLAVIADGVRLEQILINLIQNAIDALVNTPDPRILIKLDTADDVALIVADNGPGVVAERADTLFTPFVTGKSDGLGLGLGIARDIAREFGGDIALVASSLGGAAFEVRLKRAHV